MQRKNEIKIRLTDSELNALTKKVRKSGLSREAFLRRLISGAEVKEAPSADVHKLIREMRRVGYNINQILLRINAQNVLDLPQFRKDMEDLRKVLQLVIDEHTMGKG